MSIKKLAVGYIILFILLFIKLFTIDLFMFILGVGLVSAVFLLLESVKLVSKST